MRFQLDAGQPMTEQLRTLSGIVQNLKDVAQDIHEDEQILKVIRTLPDTDFLRNFSQVMAHNDSIKTFEVISKHLKIEDEKILSRPNVALVAKGCKPKGKRPFCDEQVKKDPRAPQNSQLGKGIAKKQEIRAMETGI